MAESPNQSTPTTEISDVVIVGGGFAGMNTGRLLAKMGISSQIYSSGFGASKLWMGTVDVLNYPGDNLLLELAKFQVSLPAHPYSNQSMELMQEALNEFYENFPSLYAFRDKDEICNGHVLTSLGNTKLTTGVWNTIFRDFDTLTENSICILIEFREFTNSAMHLVAKGLSDKFPGQYLVLEISLVELFRQMNSDLVDKVKSGEISAKVVAKFFDSKAIHMSPLASLIKAEISETYPDLAYENIQCMLFPPILGIENSPTIFTHLSSHLGVECYEIVSLTPSILADRFLHQFERKLHVLTVPMHTGMKLEDLEKKDDYWVCHFRSQKGEIEKIPARFVVISVGSVFAYGLFSESIELGNRFHRLGLDFPDSIGKNYEVISTNDNSNLFVVGASNFIFSTDLSDEDEVRDGTGLGLAITSSYKVADNIKNRLQPEN